MLRDDHQPLPYYQWYWADARSDRRWQRLSLHAKGALHEIFDECWKEGGVPNDPARLAEICGCTRREIDEMMPQLMTLLYEVEPGLLSNRRLERMRTAKDRERAVRSRSGKKGGRAKASAQIELLSGAKQKPSKRHIEEQEHKQEHKQEKNYGSADAPPTSGLNGEHEQIVIERWNITAAEAGFPVMVSYNAGRKRALRARLKEPGWFDRVHAALAFLATSQWHRDNPISFDTFVRPGKVDQYYERAQLGPSSNGAKSRGDARRDVDDGILADLERGGGRLRDAHA